MQAGHEQHLLQVGPAVASLSASELGIYWSIENREQTRLLSLKVARLQFRI